MDSAYLENIKAVWLDESMRGNRKNTNVIESAELVPVYFQWQLLCSVPD